MGGPSSTQHTLCASSLYTIVNTFCFCRLLVPHHVACFHAMEKMLHTNSLVQVERVADMLLSLAERERDVVATDGWSLDQEWDELVALGISMLISASGLALWYFIG